MRTDKIDFWHAKNKSVLFIGRAGVGKSALVYESMTRNNLSFDKNAMYWSVTGDLVGCNIEDADFLYFDFANDFDAQRAMYEIFSLRRWRGKAIKPTARIWACLTIDAEGSTPDIGCQDRFDVACVFPYKMDADYFKAKYGDRVAGASIEWWNDLPAEEKDAISPRRMDFALQMWANKGDIRDVLPFSSNCVKLMTLLNVGPIVERLSALLTDDDAARRLFFANENNYAHSLRYVADSEQMMEAFLPCFPEGKLAEAFGQDGVGDKLLNFVLKRAEKPEYAQVLRSILSASTHQRLCKKIRRALTEQSDYALWLQQGLKADRKVSETTDQ